MTAATGDGGGGGGGGKDLLATGLDEVARGLTAALAELKELGMVGAAGAGRGFAGVALNGLELGHQGLTGAFGEFCERWEWGVRSLIGEGNGLAVRTGLAAGTYYETDQYVEGTLKVAANSLIGNPYATEDEVTSMGWRELATSGHLGGADYSAESFARAQENVEQAWKDTGRDVMTSRMGLVAPQNVADGMGVSGAEYERMLDEAFGPSPEERARQAGGGAG